MIIHPLLLVSGSRYHTGVKLIEASMSEAVEELRADGPVIVIIGDCRTGADAIAKRWAEAQPADMIYNVEEFDARWTRFNRAAGPIRNTAMVERALVQHIAGAPVKVLGFPLENSSGTEGLLKIARAARIRDIKEIR